MVDPVFVSHEEAVLIHRQMIENYGGVDGQGEHGVGLLDSALAMPRQQFGGQYLHEDLAAMAAAYWYYIANAHAFIDGNKRTSAFVALFFLKNNGYEVTFTSAQIEKIAVQVVTKQLSKDDLAKVIRKHKARRGR